VDLFYAHIDGMDAFARALTSAHAILEDGRIPDFVAERYAGWDKGLGKAIMDGTETLESLEKHAMNLAEPEIPSGRQEYLERILGFFV
jgi:xylose isomerase